MIGLKSVLLAGVTTGFLVGFASTSRAQSISSTITVYDTTSGSNAAGINTMGSNGGCSAATGSGTAICNPQTPVAIADNSNATYTPMFTASNAYNTLYQATVTMYLNVQDPGISMQSGTNCSWTVQMIKQSSGTWQPTVKVSSSQDTNTPLVPNCTYSNLSYNTSTGQFSISVKFGGS